MIFFIRVIKKILLFLVVEKKIINFVKIWQYDYEFDGYTSAPDAQE